MYKMFGKRVEFKKYLHGVSDVRTRLFFKVRSRLHDSNEELGRSRGREGKSECSLCGVECESVVHVLWECTAYGSSRTNLTEKLQELLDCVHGNAHALQTYALPRWSEPVHECKEETERLTYEHVHTAYCTDLGQISQKILSHKGHASLVEMENVRWEVVHVR